MTGLLAVGAEGAVIERNPTQAEIVAGLGFLPPTADQVQGTTAFNPWTAETDTGSSVTITRTNGVVTSVTDQVLNEPRVTTINWVNGRVTSVVMTWSGHTHTETLNYDGSGNVTSVSLTIT